MKKYKPYLALDIETTGLSHESSVIQLAAIWDNDPTRDPDELPRIDMNIKLDGKCHVEFFALGMNAKILEATKENGLTLSQAKDKWGLFVSDLFYQMGEKRFSVAGKNAAGFDLPILKNQGFNTNYFMHRVLDVGSMYFEDFGYIPNLTEINKLLGNSAVAHTAYEDCLDVVRAVRAKLEEECL